MNKQEVWETVNTAVYQCIQRIAQTDNVPYDLEIISTVRNQIARWLAQEDIIQEDAAYPWSTKLVLFRYHVSSDYPLPTIIEAASLEEAKDIAFEEYGISLAQCPNPVCDGTIWEIVGVFDELDDILSNIWNIKGLSTHDRMRLSDGKYRLWRA